MLFLIVSLALLHTSVMTLDQNMRDMLRDEAIKIGEARISEARSLCFTNTCDSLTSATDTDGKYGAVNMSSMTGFPAAFPSIGVPVTESVGNASNFIFFTNREVTVPSTDIRQVVVEVGYMWRGTKYDHKISTLVRRS